MDVFVCVCACMCACVCVVFGSRVVSELSRC